jgi:hypothetical protein
VCNAKPEVAHPLPAQRRAQPNQKQPADYEHHKTEMNYKNKVGEPGHGFVTW